MLEGWYRWQTDPLLIGDVLSIYAKMISAIFKSYHEWMESPELQYFTGSEALTLEDEFLMQQRWCQDQDKCTFIILEKSILLNTCDEIEAMIGDTNLFLNDPYHANTAEAEIMIANAAYRNKKRGWEAMILMLLYGIDKLKVTRYRVKIKFDNENSIKMFTKLQFQEMEKNRVFHECTLEKVVSEEWREWLHSEIVTINYDIYEDTQLPCL